MSALKVCPQCNTEYPANARFCEIDGTALRVTGAASADLVGSVIADRYLVMRKLGEGGMGQVYLVEHVKMGRKSALKVMHPGMVKDVDAISRFNREAANASRISHANVAAVYDFGETPDGIIYLAMEFVDGPPLTKLVEENGALPPKRAAEIARQTAEGLTVAHDMGIVHRDLKPDNIMIAKTREGGDLVKVVDFGIAKAAGNTAQKVTKTGLVVGTPDYMSPEQLAGDSLDGRSDIYALGLVTFNMLTGTLPFPSDSAQESMIMRLTDPPKTLSEMRPEVTWPAPVQAAMDKALQRDVSQRYQTAIDFGRDLSRAIEHLGDAPRPVVDAMNVGEVVPPTRVPAPKPAPPSGPTAPAMPSIAASEGNGLPPLPTAPPKRKAMIPIVGGIAVLLVISAALYAPILRGKKPVVLPSDSTAVSPPNTSNPPIPSNPSGSVASNPTNPPGQPSSDTAHRAANDQFDKKTQNRDAAVLNVAKELSKAESEANSDDTSSARSAIRRVAALGGHLDAATDAARAALANYNAYLTLDDKDKACAALKDVKDRVRGTSYQKKVDDRLAACP